jgi:hypothetical protein
MEPEGATQSLQFSDIGPHVKAAQSAPPLPVSTTLVSALPPSVDEHILCTGSSTCNALLLYSMVIWFQY